MKPYTCPMHPDIQEDKPGRCPKCGMLLVKSDDVKKSHHAENASAQNSYRPLVIIVGLLFLVSLAATNNAGSNFIPTFIKNFMAGFFVVFAGFKLLDLKGFAAGYSTYDLLAKKWFAYGYVYPFIELFFGFAMIVNFQEQNVLFAELFIMTFSGIGVLIKLLKKERFQCACLGTFLKVPLTKVTLVEDFGMAALAGIMLAI